MIKATVRRRLGIKPVGVVDRVYQAMDWMENHLLLTTLGAFFTAMSVSGTAGLVIWIAQKV